MDLSGTGAVGLRTLKCMRIGFVVPRCLSTNSHGRYVIELTRRLAVSQDVTVYSGARCESLNGRGRFRYLPVLDWPMLARLTTVWAASAPIALFGASDILHIQGADSPIGNVVTAHCCTAAMHAAARALGFHRRFNHTIGARAEEYSLGKSTTRAVIAVSEKVKREIEKYYGIKPGMVTVIRPGVDLAAFHPDNRSRRREMRMRLGLQAEDFVAVHVGGNYRQKGLLTLVEAARLVGGPLKVVAVGVARDRALADLLAPDIQAGRVLLTGATANVASYYALADCFVLPTVYDTFSLVTLEAMASGLPVIVSSAAGITEGLTDGVDAMILDDPRNVASLAERLDEVVRDDARRRSLAEGARRTAERYSWDRVADATLAVYRSVAA
jgi:glycosyltransferase involved in cell wall biosynthesis